MEKLGLYIHVPFCKRKCLYCDFYSIEGDGVQTEAYLHALEEKERVWAKSTQNDLFDTVYVGGGTPSMLKKEGLVFLLSGVKKYFSLVKDAEVTVEVNPESVDFDMLRALKKAGYNRIGIGVQSFKEDELQALGRLHGAKEAENAVLLAKDAGFENISADLMFGIPKQTLVSFEKSIDTLLCLPVEHISCYGLKIGEGTPFYEAGRRLPLPDEDEEAQMYRLLCRKMERAGFEQYEISNFAKEGKRSRHNLKYWHCEPYIGVGPGAHSYFGGERFCDGGGLNAFLASGGKIRKDERAALTRYDLISEYLIMRLRLKEGIDKREFEGRFGVPFDETFKRVRGLCEKGDFAIEDQKRFAFTPKGFWVSNTLMEEFLIGLDSAKTS